ncbi:glycoside hydrolase family 16 protein [Aeromicrobium sp. Root344]|uniref:glycoside hydrolase family 16 protein n=1 Tax=Aeromicrobium sp. Root344 TaxID=1736521 RepID=UPI00138F4C13|nr:glycoside hydrolase family 16 protein [Aeromicrobium sp. Root344]
MRRAALALAGAVTMVVATTAPASAVWWWPTPQPAPTCGTTIYKPDGTAWKCTFADDFNTGTLDGKKWAVQQTAATGMHAGPECLVNSSRNVSVSGGSLHLTTRKEAAAFTCRSPYGAYTTQYTSGGVTTTGKFAQTYGRFEFRAKFPAVKVPGVQTALWMYPATLKYGAWPASGEIDVTEFYSQYPDRSIPYIHYNTADDSSPVTNWSCKLDPSVFNTYVAEWTTTGITISHNDTACLTHTFNPAAPLTSPQPFDQPYAVLLTQVLGTGTNTFNATSTPLPATTDVDWVRVWS